MSQVTVIRWISIEWSNTRSRYGSYPEKLGFSGVFKWERGQGWPLSFFI